MLTGMVDFTPSDDGTARTRLLDLVPGRSKKAYADWLTAFAAAVEPAYPEYYKKFDKKLIDSIRDTISTAIQVNLSMVAIDESEVNKQLAAWAAIFAVFTAFAGVWGMNFRRMPELEWEYGYPFSIAVMVVFSAAVLFYFRRKNWL